MSIDVEIQDESGVALSRYDGPPLGLQFLKLAPPKSACFRFIVPWADATFNEDQVKELRAELQEATTRTSHVLRLRELRALSKFLEGASGTHVYVKFIGD